MLHEWMHTDSRGLAVAIPAALARASSAQGFTRDAESAADFRALVMGTFYVIAGLSKRPPQPLPDGSGVRIEGPSNEAFGLSPGMLEAADERYQAAKRLGATLMTYARIVYPLSDAQIADPNAVESLLKVPSLVTTKDGELFAKGEAGWVLPALGILAGAATVIVVSVYGIQKYSELSDKADARREETRRMFDFHARVMAMLDAHRETEKLAGKVLPLTEAEKAALDTLRNVQIEAIKAKEAALTTPISDPISKVTPSGTGLTLSFTTIAIVAIVAYMVLHK